MSEYTPGEDPSETAARIRRVASDVRDDLAQNTASVRDAAENERRHARRRDWILGVMLAVVLLGEGYGFWQRTFKIGPSVEDTNQAVNHTIATLETRNASLEETVDQATFILTEQAVPAFFYMADQLRAAGLNPPEVLLDAASPPFEEQQQDDGTP